jgi:hypothetical protein
MTEDLEVERDRAELPPRIRKLISAAVRVWELKRGLRGGTCITHDVRIRKNGRAEAGTFCRHNFI